MCGRIISPGSLITQHWFTAVSCSQEGQSHFWHHAFLATMQWYLCVATNLTIPSIPGSTSSAYFLTVLGKGLWKWLTKNVQSTKSAKLESWYWNAVSSIGFNTSFLFLTDISFHLYFQPMTKKAFLRSRLPHIKLWKTFFIISELFWLLNTFIFSSILFKFTLWSS